MTVFKGFLTITKRNLNIVILYLAIFLALCIIVQKSSNQTEISSFSQERLNIAIIDRDGGKLAEGLTKYLRQFHNIKDIPDDKSILQDQLFYREIYYIVTIPKDFEHRCLDKGEKLSVTKVPGSTSGYYVDQQIQTFLTDVNIMVKSGFSLSDAIQKVQKNISQKVNITLMDRNAAQKQISNYVFMFQYMPYILLSILCYVLSFIMISFMRPDVKKRILCSAVSIRSQNFQLVLGFSVIGIGTWIICTCMPIFMYHKDFLENPNWVYYLVNTFCMMLVSLSLAFFISTLVHHEDLISAVVNVVSLGMSFICGVFVTLDIMNKTIKTLAHFFPVYWYEINNSLLSRNTDLSHFQLFSLWKGYGMQLLFAAAFLSVALIISKLKRQTIQ